MEKVRFREVIEGAPFSLPLLKDIALSLNLTIKGNKQDYIDEIIESIASPEIVIELLKADELKEVCSRFGLKSGTKDLMISQINDRIDIELFKRNISGEPLEDLDQTEENIKTKLAICKLRKKDIGNEKDAEEYIAHHLIQYFPTCSTQHNLGGYLGLKIDLDIGNGNFGIEVKLSESFFKQSSEIFRMIGQAVYYTKRKYGENFILAIAGPKADKQEPKLNEAMKFLSEIGIKTQWVNIE